LLLECYNEGKRCPAAWKAEGTGTHKELVMQVTALMVGDTVRYAPDGILWTIDLIEGQTVQIRNVDGHTMLDTVASVLRAMERVAA
jgi:hypothetical protein